MVKPYIQVYVYSVYHFTSICNIHTCVYLEICTSLCSWNSYNPHIYIVSMHILMYIVTYYIQIQYVCVCVSMSMCAKSIWTILADRSHLPGSSCRFLRVRRGATKALVVHRERFGDKSIHISIYSHILSIKCIRWGAITSLPMTRGFYICFTRDMYGGFLFPYRLLL